MTKKALLIINLGTPDSPSYFHVFKYLRQFLSDEKVLNINPILRFFLVNFIICPSRSFSSSKYGTLLMVHRFFLIPKC